MLESAYRVARRVARELGAELLLTPPFDVRAVAERYADISYDDVPGRTDCATMHARAAGDHPRIVIQTALREAPARERFAIAHALGHILLGWHPLGVACDVSSEPHEFPITAHDLVEGEANAFARELLLPRAWLESFKALDRPAELIRHAAERGGVPIMPAARAVALLLEPNVVWSVVDEWGGVLDAGRSPGTNIRPPKTGDHFDGADYAKLATERHRADLDDCTLIVWRFEDDAVLQLPHDRSSRQLVNVIGEGLGLDDNDIDQLTSRLEGVAGWANEQLGVATLEGMSTALDLKIRSTPEFESILKHGEYHNLVSAKAIELVAKRLAR